MIAQLFLRAQFVARILQYYRQDRWAVLQLLCIIGCSTLVGLAQVWPLAILVDTVLVPEGAGHSTGSAPGWGLHVIASGVVAQIAWLAVAVLVLRLIQELLSLGRTAIQVRIAHQGILRVRCDLFRKLQSLNLGFHRSQPQGDALYRLMQDAPGCDQVLNVWIEVSVAVLTLVFMLGVMVTRSVQLSLVSMAVVPMLLITNCTFGRHLKRESSAARTTESRLTSVAQRIVSNMVLVQAFQRESCEYNRFTQAAGDSATAWRRVQHRFALYRLCVGVIFGGGASLIFGYGGYLVSQRAMSVGDLMIFLTYLAMFYDPLCKISGAGANMQTGLAGMRRVFEVLDRQTLVVERQGAMELARQPRTLRLQDVSFSYNADRLVLDGVSVTIPPGQMVAFVGSSGVGKSTLLNLLPRFYDPAAGAILLDDVDLRDVRLRDVRRHIALVLQDSPILPTTIAENIAYGRPDATAEQIHEAARLAGADAFIAALPDQYQSLVAEAGQNLSGGQRQRIAIARALLTEAPIVVLDEPTSALDPLHEQQIVETLQALKRQRSLVLVSHRLSTVRDCDQIFVMEGGRVVESGTHSELLALHGHYWELARSQHQLGPAADPMLTVSAA